jgi:hypothetical protein
MDLDRSLAVFTAGGIVSLSVGAVVARLLGWPAGTGDPLAVTPVLAVAALVVVAVVAAVAWGRAGTDSGDRAYW